jgi:DNA replication and repair protein RecF
VRLQSVSVQGFRNLQPQTVVPGERATVFFGDNGQGKTNFIEAVYSLVAFRSFRARNTDELVGWNLKAARVSAEVATAGLNRVLQLQVEEGKRVCKLDGKSVRRDAASLAHIGTVLFVPEDLLLPKASPTERRRFVDLGVFGTNRSYYREAQAFVKTLKSRNSLLRRSDKPDGTLLDAYDDQLAKSGAVVVQRRRDWVAKLGPKVAELFQKIHGEPVVGIRYVGHETVNEAVGVLELEAGLRQGLAQRRDLDLRRGFSGYGPHKDDLELMLGAYPARDHGSQGQLRSLVLALKLAELEILAEALQEPPLLLLDDVASELDEARRSRLFETIASLSGQTFITVTDRHFLPNLTGRLDYHVERGILKPVQG